MKKKTSIFNSVQLVHSHQVDNFDLEVQAAKYVVNEIFRYTRCKTPKRVTSLRGPSPRRCARATQLLSKKCRSGGEPGH